MEEKTQTQTEAKSRQKWIIALLLLLIVLLGAVLAAVLLRDNTQNISDGDTPRIGYATEATVLLDENSLQAAIDEAIENAKNGMVALRYQNDAFSDDGETFSCYIVNDGSNLYDMFITLYSDAALTDQLYLSGLVPPGSGFEELTLDRALPSGDTTVYVAVTQVDTDEDDQQIITGQVVHTIEFHVT